MQKITPFLWFDTEAEAAVNFYVSIFDHSRVVNITRYGDAGPGPKGSVMTVVFELDGLEFTALNGGPQFKFTEAVSFSVDCKTQEEVDRFWEQLSKVRHCCARWHRCVAALLPTEKALGKTAQDQFEAAKTVTLVQICTEVARTRQICRVLPYPVGARPTWLQICNQVARPVMRATSL